MVTTGVCSRSRSASRSTTSTPRPRSSAFTWASSPAIPRYLPPTHPHTPGTSLLPAPIRPVPPSYLPLYARLPRRHVPNLPPNPICPPTYQVVAYYPNLPLCCTNLPKKPTREPQNTLETLHANRPERGLCLSLSLSLPLSLPLSQLDAKRCSLHLS
eukprot:3236507-Rhodomonas_salina.1